MWLNVGEILPSDAWDGQLATESELEPSRRRRRREGMNSTRVRIYFWVFDENEWKTDKLDDAWGFNTAEVVRCAQTSRKRRNAPLTAD